MEEPKLEKPMKKIYIAGSYRAATKWKIMNNIRRAERVGLEVCKQGMIAVVPHVMFSNYEGELTDTFFLQASMSMLEICDGSIFLPGWGASGGSSFEMAKCKKIELPCAALNELVSEYSTALPRAVADALEAMFGEEV